MEKRNDIPVFIGVTGHRRFRREGDDEARLRQQVKRTLLEISHGFGCTRFVLLTALAAGADQLVAEVAAELGMKYAVVLPIPKRMYLERCTSDGADFTRAERENAERLMNDSEHCLFVRVIPLEQRHGVTEQNVCDYSDPSFAERQFRETARFISDNTCATIALWDGLLAPGATAGTGATVRDCLHGHTYRSDCFSGITIPETRPIYHIYTPREGAEPKAYDFGLRRLFPEPLLETGDSWFTIQPALERGGDAAVEALFSSKPDETESRRAASVRKQLKAINSYNRDLSRKSRLLSGGGSGLGISDPCDRAAFIEKYYLDSRNLARWYKRKRALLSRAIIICAGISYLMLCIFSDLFDSLPFLALYVGGVLLTWLIWRYTGRRAYHSRFVNDRALAEGLRVQGYWYEADICHEGIPAQTQDFYLRKQKSETEWVRLANRSINLLALSRFEGRAPRPAQVDAVAKVWLGSMDEETPEGWVSKDDGRAGYFKRKALSCSRLGRGYSLWSGVLLAGSFLLAAALLIMLVLFEGSDLVQSAKGYIIFATGALPVLAMILGELAQRDGYEKDADRYEWYYAIFKRSIVEIDELGKPQPDGAALSEQERMQAVQSKLFDIGCEALIENADWVVLNADRAPAVPTN